MLFQNTFHNLSPFKGSINYMGMDFLDVNQQQLEKYVEKGVQRDSLISPKTVADRKGEPGIRGKCGGWESR